MWCGNAVWFMYFLKYIFSNHKNYYNKREE